MKNFHGTQLSFEREMELLGNGYEWFDSYEFNKIIKPEGVKYHIGGVDENTITGKIEYYLVQVGGNPGHHVPTVTFGCRLRTGNPDYGR